MRKTAVIVLGLLVSGGVLGRCPAQPPASQDKDAKRTDQKKNPKNSEQGLKEAIQALHKAMESGKREEQEKALRDILPSQKDIEILFPKHAARLQPFNDQARQEYIKHAPEVAKELTRHGAIQAIEVDNVRSSDKNKSYKSYKRVLEMIPKEVPVYEFHIQFKEARSSGAAYLFVNDHWIFFKDVETVPEAIDKIEKGELKLKPKDE